eukprot:GHRQ01007994.1.p1 GENE.GHRQ01007994.1~~GHRQ01007994.1.p1  ORF type:complete len:171 (+),score=64.15 GHRQ01007994.1:768-1280(+)
MHAATATRSISQHQQQLASSAAAADAGWLAGSRRSRCRHICQSLDPVMVIASTDPAALQDVIVGGAVTAAVGAALYSGLKKDPIPCDLCAGNGGIRCFACSSDMLGSSGSMSSLDDLIDKDVLLPPEQRKRPKRDILGRSGGNPRACKVCKGTGLVLCSKCRGSGYMSKF